MPLLNQMEILKTFLEIELSRISVCCYFFWSFLLLVLI